MGSRSITVFLEILIYSFYILRLLSFAYFSMKTVFINVPRDSCPAVSAPSFIIVIEHSIR